MAAPKAATFGTAYPGRIVGIGQDPPDKLAAFDQQFGLGFHSESELPPYEALLAGKLRVGGDFEAAKEMVRQLTDPSAPYVPPC